MQLLVVLYPSTAWKVSKYGVFFIRYFPVFGLNTGKYAPEKTPYLDTFHTVRITLTFIKLLHLFELLHIQWYCFNELNKNIVSESKQILAAAKVILLNNHVANHFILQANTCLMVAIRMLGQSLCPRSKSLPKSLAEILLSVMNEITGSFDTIIKCRAKVLLEKRFYKTYDYNHSKIYFLKRRRNDYHILSFLSFRSTGILCFGKRTNFNKVDQIFYQDAKNRYITLTSIK